MADAERMRRQGPRTIVFVDEIHRFNKAQQDAFLPYVERGDIILIGATTENPSFEIISALLSRTKVYLLRALTAEEMTRILRRALEDGQRGLGQADSTVADDMLERMALFSNGDARSALQTLETAVASAAGSPITAELLGDVLQRKVLPYDKAGEEHYNPDSGASQIRSLERSRRRFVLAGAHARSRRRPPLHCAPAGADGFRRHRPSRSSGAGAGHGRVEAFRFIGEPEGDLVLAQVAVYLSMAPKSDAVYGAYNRVKQDVETSATEPVPMQLRNAPTKLMKDSGYGEGYRHAHQFEDAVTDMECLPDSLRGRCYYSPTDRGFEKRIAEKLEELRKRKGRKDE